MNEEKHFKNIHAAVRPLRWPHSLGNSSRLGTMVLESRLLVMPFLRRGSIFRYRPYVIYTGVSVLQWRISREQPCLYRPLWSGVTPNLITFRCQIGSGQEASNTKSKTTPISWRILSRTVSWLLRGFISVYVGFFKLSDFIWWEQYSPTNYLPHSMTENRDVIKTTKAQFPLSRRILHTCTSFLFEKTSYVAKHNFNNIQQPHADTLVSL